MKRRRQVCLFGTSANPPTGVGGHVGIVRALSSSEETPGQRTFDEVWVLPVYQHTFSSKRQSLISYDHRMSMCRLAFQEMPNVVVSDAEQRSFHRILASSSTPAESLRVGTADLLEMLMEQHPTVDFAFCLGADTFLDLTEWKWRRSKDVLRLLGGRLVVIPRKGSDEQYQEGLEARISALKQMGLDVPCQIRFLQDTNHLEQVSSSMARQCTTEEGLSNLLNDEVTQYIIRHRLYKLGVED